MLIVLYRSEFRIFNLAQGQSITDNLAFFNTLKKIFRGSEIAMYVRRNHIR